VYIILFGDVKSVTNFCLANFKEKAIKAPSCGFNNSIESRRWGKSVKSVKNL